MVKQRKIVIGHLYPKQMNVYGDMGNVLTLRHRLVKRNITCEYIQIDSLKQLNQSPIDILIAGGGQDSNQSLIEDDMHSYGSELIAQCSDGLTVLAICGMYQLFGNRFVMGGGGELKGLGIIDMETKAGDDRLIGNVIVDSPFGLLVGFENHSGRTYLGDGVAPLGKVIKGAGNNNETTEEGAVVNNVFGTYLHGPALAKNPIWADELIKRALCRKGLSEELVDIDDTIANFAAKLAAKRPR